MDVLVKFFVSRVYSFNIDLLKWARCVRAAYATEKSDRGFPEIPLAILSAGS